MAEWSAFMDQYFEAARLARLWGEHLIGGHTLKWHSCRLPMKDNDKRRALIRLRDIIYSGVRPTVRECGFSSENIQELTQEGLIQSQNKTYSDEPDGYVIEEILPAGHDFILQHHTSLSPLA